METCINLIIKTLNFACSSSSFFRVTPTHHVEITTVRLTWQIRLRSLGGRGVGEQGYESESIGLP